MAKSLPWYLEDDPPLPTSSGRDDWYEKGPDALEWLAGDALVHKTETRPLYQQYGLPDERFQALATAIRDSREMLHLAEGWDDEGAKPIRMNTWTRATDFLRGHALHASNLIGKCIIAPVIQPLSDGSIDLHWRAPDGELLINFPAADNEPAQFYGDTPDGLHIKGTIDPTARNWGVLDWLTHF